MIKFDADYNTSTIEERLDEITWHDGKLLATGERIPLGPNAILFVQAEPEFNSFHFCFVSFTSAQTSDQWNGSQDIWECPDVCVERQVFGWAAFDGIRHIYMPYVNYPDIPVLIQLFQELDKLQHRYCTAL